MRPERLYLILDACHAIGHFSDGVDETTFGQFDQLEAGN